MGPVVLLILAYYKYSYQYSSANSLSGFDLTSQSQPSVSPLQPFDSARSSSRGTAWHLVAAVRGGSSVRVPT